MRIIEQSYEILSLPNHPIISIEQAARTCYKSEDKITLTSGFFLVQQLIDRKHHAMLEFEDITVKLITDRGVSHEMVRHRLCSFAQESTRYVRYGGDMEFIKPTWIEYGISPAQNDFILPSDIPYKKKVAITTFVESVYGSSIDYLRLLNNGLSPQDARTVLPNALKTEIVVKANLREWRHIFDLRCSKAAHPQIRALLLPLLKELSTKIPVIFDDLVTKYIK